MKEQRAVIWNNLTSGINAVLPIIILVFLLSWGFKIIFQLIDPFVIFLAPREADRTLFVKVSALILVLVIVSIIGAVLQKPEGRRRFFRFETRIFKILPGYSMIKDTIMQFLGTKRTPFSTVAIVRPFANQTKQIAFVADELEDGSYTVFVPTGPNPTSGNIFILSKEQVELVDMPVDQAMKTIISCGIGIGALPIDKTYKNNPS